MPCEFALKTEKTMKKSIKYVVFLALVPAVAILGATVFDEKSNIWISLCAAVLSCVPFVFGFERKSSAKIVLLSVMTALSVAGRAAFFAVPFFKPVTAIVMLCGMYLGADAGFMCGALSAFISNFIFSQGPWTPFQMLAWGLTGFASALLSKPLRESRFCLCAAGAIGGFLYSFILDISSVLWIDNAFSFARYAEMLVLSMPMTLIYAVSNVVFLLLLAATVGKKLERIETKYGL